MRLTLNTASYQGIDLNTSKIEASPILLIKILKDHKLVKNRTIQHGLQTLHSLCYSHIISICFLASILSRWPGSQNKCKFLFLSPPLNPHSPATSHSPRSPPN